MEHKVIITTDEAEILNLIDRARRGHTVRMIGMGRSMRPLLEDGRDYIELTAVDAHTALKKNDVIFYKSFEGLYVLHRILSVTEDRYIPNGDANLLLEPPLKREDIYLKAVGFIRKGRYITVDSLLYRCYVRIWTACLPIRTPLLRWYDRYRRLSFKLRRRRKS